MMKKHNLALELLKLGVSFVIGWILWVFIFACMPGDGVDESEFFPGASVVFGILTGVLVTLGNKYNYIQKAFQTTKSTKSNIQVYQEKEKKLLEKANRVAEKYMNYEEKVQTNITKERTKGIEPTTRHPRIHSSKQFMAQLENYPDLKANQSIIELLKQIQDCENSLAYQKVAYNTSVEEYNTLIHSFPETLLRLIFRFKDVEYYKVNNEEDIISDEELGI